MAEAQQKLLEQVLQCPKKAVVLTGPAGSGKTTAVLGFYRRWNDLAEPGRCVILVPNAPAVNHIKQQLIRSSGRGVEISPQVTTFSGLCGDIVAAAGPKAKAITTLGRQMLLRRIVKDLCSRCEIPALGLVADTPGLYVALDRAIAELKRAAIDPVQLERALSACGPGERRLGDLARPQSQGPIVEGSQPFCGAGVSSARPLHNQDLQARAPAPQLPPATEALRDLLAVYQAYQSHLLEADQYDVEGQAWLARQSLAAAESASLAELGLGAMRTVAVDGFTDFTPTQLDILKLLSVRLEKLLITLPIQADERQRLWQWSGRTLSAILTAFGATAEQINIRPGDICRHDSAMEDPAGETPAPQSPAQVPAPQSPAPQAARAAFWHSIFNNSRPAPVEDASGLSVVAASGIEAEVTAVARRIKRELLAGLEQPTTNGRLRIAVLARSLEAYRPVISRVFRQHGIAIKGWPTPLTDVPVVSFALAAAEVAPEFHYRSVLKVIKSSYFDPSALGDFDSSSVAAAEMIIRRGNVLSGRASFAQAAGRLLNQMRRAEENARVDGEQAVDALPQIGVAQVQSGAAMLEQLFALCESVSLNEIVNRLNLKSAAMQNGDDEIIARDLRALDQLEQALSQIGASADGRLPGISELQELLSAVSCAAPRGSWMVDVLDVLDARAIRYDHVFLIGCSEGQFPLQAAEGALLNEADKLRLASAGLHLDSRSDLLGREMLLFYLAISRADRALTVSYLQSDGGGRVKGPGSFLQYLLNLHGGLEALRKAGRVSVIPPGDIVPSPEDALCADDAFNAAVAGLFQEAPAGRRGMDRQGASSDDLLAFAAKHRQEQFARAMHGIWARHRRWTAGPCNEFDGRLSDIDLLAFLARQFGASGGEALSASQINTFGQCPWLFFASYVLKLAPLQEPQRQLEAVAWGIFCHNVLYRLMSRLGQLHGLPVSLVQVDAAEMEAELDLAIAAESARVESVAPPYPALWQLQRQQMARQLRAYLSELRQSPWGRLASMHFELTFGLDAHGGEPRDPASVTNSVMVDTPAGPIALRGKIDRVDVLEVGGKRSLLIVDYKTGRLPSPGDITSGRNLQAPLYSMAAEKLLERECAGGAFHQVGQDAGRITSFCSLTARKGQIIENEKFAQQWQDALDALGRHIDSIRAGRFDLEPSGDCPSYCPMRLICHFSPARREVKAQGAGSTQEASA